MVLSTKDKRTCACLTPPEAFADKENCCSSDACTVAEVQAMYQLPTGQQHTLHAFTPSSPPPTCPGPGPPLGPKGKLGLTVSFSLIMLDSVVFSFLSTKHPCLVIPLHLDCAGCPKVFRDRQNICMLAACAGTLCMARPSIMHCDSASNHLVTLCRHLVD